MEDLRNHTDLRGPAGDRLRKPVVRCENLVFSYGTGSFRLEVPELDIAPGRRVALVGPSGCGKTTLVHLIAGILKPQKGSVAVGEVQLGAYSLRDLLDFRIATIGLIFQEFKLLEYLSVYDNILLPYRLNPILQLDDDIRSRAASLGREVGLEDKLGRYPKHLSQGERQRVAVCRALVTKPSLLLCDEPTANLDPANRDHVLKILFDYCKESDASLLMVTHDPEILHRFDQKIDIRTYLPEHEPTNP